MADGKINEKRRNSWPQIIFYALSVFLIVMAIVTMISALIGSGPFENEHYSLDTDATEYNGEWTWYAPDGATGTFTGYTDSETAKLIREHVKTGEKLVIETVLPSDTRDNKYFMFQAAHQSVKIYLDTEEGGNIPDSDGAGSMLDAGNNPDADGRPDTDEKPGDDAVPEIDGKPDGDAVPELDEKNNNGLIADDGQTGELMLDYGTTGMFWAGNNSPTKYLTVKLRSAYAGATLRIEIISNTEKYVGVVHESYFGELSAIWLSIFMNHSKSMIIAILLWATSLEILLLCLFFRLAYKQSFKLAYLAWSAFWVASWMLFESRFRQVIYPNVTLIACLAFLTVPLISFAAMLYMDYLQKNRYHKAYLVSYAVLTADFFICLLLHLTKAADLLETSLYNYIISVLAVMVVIVTTGFDLFKRKNREYLIVAAGFAVLVFLAVIEIIVGLNNGYNYTGLAFGVGMLIYLLTGTWYMIKQQVKSTREAEHIRVVNETKDMFLATMSHEIRTPINSVIGMNQMIMRENTNPQISEYAANIDRAGAMLLGLVNDILDFSKIGSGKMKIITKEYSTAAMIHDLATLTADRAHEKGLKMLVECDENLPSRLEGDIVRIKQILTNLLTNAVKYTSEGSVSLIVMPEYGPDGNFLLHMEVKDSGQGIRPENIDKIFDSFARLEERANSGIEGSGLGLAITKQLVELMNGSISVTSTFGKGSTFTVLLPQKVVDRTPVGKIDDIKKNQNAETHLYRFTMSAPGAKILSVDDNVINLAVISGLLKPTQIQVKSVQSGDAAIEACRQDNFDLILMDHMMPDKDGIKTFHELQEMWKTEGGNTPVVALTANAVAGMREMYLNEGFADYLSKPVSMDELERVLYSYIPAEKIMKQEQKQQ